MPYQAPVATCGFRVPLVINKMKTCLWSHSYHSVDTQALPFKTPYMEKKASHSVCDIASSYWRECDVSSALKNLTSRITSDKSPFESPALASLKPSNIIETPILSAVPAIITSDITDKNLLLASVSGRYLLQKHTVAKIIFILSIFYLLICKRTKKTDNTLQSSHHPGVIEKHLRLDGATYKDLESALVSSHLQKQKEKTNLSVILTNYQDQNIPLLPSNVVLLDIEGAIRSLACLPENIRSLRLRSCSNIGELTIGGIKLDSVHIEKCALKKITFGANTPKLSHLHIESCLHLKRIDNLPTERLRRLILQNNLFSMRTLISRYPSIGFKKLRVLSFTPAMTASVSGVKEQGASSSWMDLREMKELIALELPGPFPFSEFKTILWPSNIQQLTLTSSLKWHARGRASDSPCHLLIPQSKQLRTSRIEVIKLVQAERISMQKELLYFRNLKLIQYLQCTPEVVESLKQLVEGSNIAVEETKSLLHL